MSLRSGESPKPDLGFARSEIVNRTHRIVREQATEMQAQRRRSRSLLVPLAICSGLMLLISYAIWAVMDGYDLTPNGVPDASDQVLLLLLWSFPVTAVVIGFLWLQRQRSRSSN